MSSDSKTLNKAVNAFYLVRRDGYDGTKNTKDFDHAALKVYQAIVQCGNSQDAVCGYGAVASDFDHMYIEYNSVAVYGAELCVKYLQDSQHSAMLDIAAGTGALAHHLRSTGKFTGKLDILDGSMDMLYQASKKNLRCRSIIQHLVQGDIPLPQDSYDVVTCFGSLIPSHISPSGIKGMLKLVKPGGYLIFNDEENADREYYKELHSFIGQLQNDRKMLLVEKTELAKIICQEYKVTFGFLVFQKL